MTLLEPQSRFGDKPLIFQVVCPQNGTAVLKGLRGQLTVIAEALGRLGSFGGGGRREAVLAQDTVLRRVLSLPYPRIYISEASSNKKGYLLFSMLF